MPKVTIDTDLLAEELRVLPASERANYLLSHIREIHMKTEQLPAWAKLASAKEQAKKSEAVGGYPAAFLKFWAFYPPRNGTRVGKAMALKAWKKVKGISEAELLLACLESLKWQKQDEQWEKDNGTFIPMATTYLNQRRWEDEGNNPDDWEEYTNMNGAKMRRRKT